MKIATIQYSITEKGQITYRFDSDPEFNHPYASVAERGLALEALEKRLQASGYKREFTYSTMQLGTVEVALFFVLV